MAKQIQLSEGSHSVFGSPGSGKTFWCIENFLANPNFAIYIDYNKAVYRSMAKQPPEHKDIRKTNWFRGPWSQCKKPVLVALAQTRKAIYAPNSDDDIQGLADSLRSLKEKNLENVETIWVYCDEIDLYGDKKSSVEQFFTKDRGAGVRPVGIVQRPGQVANRSIVDNSFGGVLVFAVEAGEAKTMRQNYSLEFSDDDLAYIQSTQYAAIYLDRTKFPRTWQRL